jgi:hypothetical protein
MVVKMNQKKTYKPPEKSAGDAVHSVTRAGLGTIPFAGAAASELLTAIVTPPLERRRSKWMEEIGEALQNLEEKMGVVLESLQEKDQFIDVALEATQIAIRTSNQEKREALKNAILNSASPNPPEESLQKMFLSFIDTLTVWHLKLLDLFNDPQAYIQKQNLQFSNNSMEAISHLIENAFPELRGRRDFYENRFSWKLIWAKN